jgi:hypothetical protein
MALLRWVKAGTVIVKLNAVITRATIVALMASKNSKLRTCGISVKSHKGRHASRWGCVWGAFGYVWKERLTERMLA